MQVSASLEDYLKAISHTVEAKGAARAKDLVMALGVHNSSVTQALRSLAEKKLINYAPYDVITLTESGKSIAVDVVNRHTTLAAFLENVFSLPANEANEGACRIEHVISPVVFDRFVKFVEYFENCPMKGVQWDDVKGFFCGSAAVDNCGRTACATSAELSPKLAQLKETES